MDGNLILSAKNTVTGNILRIVITEHVSKYARNLNTIDDFEELCLAVTKMTASPSALPTTRWVVACTRNPAPNTATGGKPARYGTRTSGANWMNSWGVALPGMCGKATRWRSNAVTASAMGAARTAASRPVVEREPAERAG